MMREMLAELTDPDARAMIGRTHAIMSFDEFEDVVQNMKDHERTAFEGKMRRGDAPEEREWAKSIGKEISEYLAAPRWHRS